MPRHCLDGPDHGPFPRAPHRSATLLSLFSTLRLAAALEVRRHGSLADLSGLLGCPLNLFDMVRLLRMLCLLTCCAC